MIYPRRKIRQALWALNGYIGTTSSLDHPQKVTILLTYYHPARMKDIDSQVRNFLKCTFVEKIVITNHNPDIQIEDKISIRDDRVILINHGVRRANGYRWRVASTLDAEYFIVIDDDIFLYPSQLKVLFQHLLSESSIPHGYSGQVLLKNNQFEYRECENIEVDYLCELYAVTRKHINQYFELERLIVEQDKTLSDFIERYAEHIIISQTAPQRPKIHKTTRLLRSDTFKAPGIATHKDEQFESSMVRVCSALKNIMMPILSSAQ